MKRRKLSISKSCRLRKKITGIKRLMFIGTQCDLWGKPDGTEHDKNKSREISSTYFYALIPVYLSGNNSIGFHFQPHPHDSHTVQQPVAVKHTPNAAYPVLGVCFTMLFYITMPFARAAEMGCRMTKPSRSCLLFEAVPSGDSICTITAAIAAG